MIQKRKKGFRYVQLAAEIQQKIINGTYRPGEKLPSIRKLHKLSNLSISTVYRAYVELETLGLVAARFKSGYYVKAVALKDIQAPAFIKKRVSSPKGAPVGHDQLGRVGHQ